jgi:transcriptional regulator with XRE-family HTH domain
MATAHEAATVNRERGQWLKRLREDSELTQEKLAERCFLSVDTIRNYESERRRPDRECIRLILEELNVPKALIEDHIRWFRHLSLPHGWQPWNEWDLSESAPDVEPEESIEVYIQQIGGLALPGGPMTWNEDELSKFTLTQEFFRHSSRMKFIKIASAIFIMILGIHLSQIFPPSIDLVYPESSSSNLLPPELASVMVLWNVGENTDQGAVYLGICDDTTSNRNPDTGGCLKNNKYNKRVPKSGTATKTLEAGKPYLACLSADDLPGNVGRRTSCEAFIAQDGAVLDFYFEDLKYIPRQRGIVGDWASWFRQWVSVLKNPSRTMGWPVE